MIRLLTTLLAAYGLRLSLRSTENIVRLGQEAGAGSAEAAQHFTQTRYARVLGPRNSDLGMVFYSLVALSTLTGLVRRRSILGGLLVASGASVLMSLYLLWALVFRLRVWCALCMQGHGINIALFATLLRMWRARSV